MSLNVTVAPVKEAVPLDHLKEHVRVIGDEDDAYLRRLEKAAVSEAETYTGLALITRTYRATFDSFAVAKGRVIELEMPPLQSVTSVLYNDADGVQQTLSASSYQVDTRSTPGRIILNDGETWPSTEYAGNSVEILYVAGYGDSYDKIPEDIRLAIGILVEHWYDHRGLVEIGPGLQNAPMPKSFDSILMRHKVRWPA